MRHRHYRLYMSRGTPLTRILAVALAVGLGAGAVVGGQAISTARMDGGATRGGGYAALSANPNVAGSATGAARCRNCRDSYAIDYLDDPDRPRDSVRVADERYVGLPGAGANDAAEPSRPRVHRAPPEPGWGTSPAADIPPPGYGDPRTETARAQRAAERARRDAVIAQQHAYVDATLTAMGDPVAVHRGTDQMSAPDAPPDRPAPGD